jgi:hypothetical protein
MKAITSIIQRSEREADQERLLRSFVDAGIKPLLENTNNQIVYGRRGTGKTHLLKVLDADAMGAPTIPIYIDARTLGSTSQFSDASLPIKDRCLSLFRDIFSELYNSLLSYLVDLAPDNAGAALDRLDEVMSTVTTPIEKVHATKIEEKSSSEKRDDTSIRSSISAKPELGAKINSNRSSSEDIQTSFSVLAEEKVVFPELQAALRSLLNAMEVRLVILLDEWSSIPLDLQPYLAEFLKRSIIPNAKITLKIASLEYRSQFSLRDDGKIIGFELGADISANLDIDDYYVFDRNPRGITEIFATILFRHLEPDLGPHLANNYGISSGDDFVNALFANHDVFQELVRAAEGVVRDLINIFTSAAVHSLRRGRETIDRKAVLEAARQWYEQDKVKELGDDLRTVLEAIVQDVIGERRSRAFLISRDLEKHPVIQKLFDARVLHVMQRGYADKDNPGQRYNIYSIDYGTYVDLLNTSKAPQIDFSNAEGPEFVVPFDDKRSIRRIILPAEILEKSA